MSETGQQGSNASTETTPEVQAPVVSTTTTTVIVEKTVQTPVVLPGHMALRTLHEMAHYPAHEPDRSKDPYYKLFHATRHHMIDVLGVGCWIGGATKKQIEAGLPEGHPCRGCTGLELHHAPLEYAGLSEIAWRKVAEDFPDANIHSDEEMYQFSEQEGNATILCSVHHRSPTRGIHWITYPLWVLQRFEKSDWDFCSGPAAVGGRLR